MADNVTANPGTGGSVFATDDIGGIHYPIEKLAFGALDSATLVTTSDPFPVQLRSSAGTELATGAAPLRIDPTGTTTQPISAASLPLPAGASTSANQTTEITSLQLIDDIIKTDDAVFTPATDKVAMVGAEFDDTTPDSVDEGDAGALRMSANRNLYTQIRDAAGNERGVNVSAANALKVDGSAVTQPISGSVSVSGTVTVDGSAVTQPISAASLPLPAGAATSANQTTEITSLQLIDDIIKTDDASFTPGTDKVAMIGAEFDDAAPDSVDEGDAGALRMSANRNLYFNLRDGTGSERGVVVTAANALKVDGSAVTQPISGSVSVSGTVTVDGSAVTQPISAASLPLPSGAATSANQSTEITSLQLIDDIVKVEDVAHGSGDSGVMSLAVRRDADTSLVDTTGDYAPLQVNATGSLKVAITAGAGGTSMTDDTAFTPATSTVSPIGAFFDDAAPDSVDEGDIGAVRMSGNRNLYTQLRDAAGNERGVNVTAANALKVDGSAVTQPVSGTISVSGTVTVDGSAVTQPISAASLPLPTGAATSANQSTEITSLQLIDDIIKTDDASFTPATDKVAMVGAEFDDTTPDSVDEGDAGALRMSANRNLYVNLRDGTGSERGVSVTAANALKVDGSAVTQPISGSVSVSGTVTVDGSAVTQPISAASLPLPTGAATAANQSTEITSLQLIDDIIKTDDAAFTPGTDKVAMIGAEFDNTTPDSVDEGDAGALRMSANRNLYTQLRDGAGNERSVNVTAANALVVDGSAVTQPVSGTISVSGTVTVDTELPTAAALADATANPTTPTIGVDNSLFNGTTWDRVRSVTNGQDTTGTGISAAGLLGQLDDTATGTVTENQFAPVRISTRRALLVEGVASGTNINVVVNTALPTGTNNIGDVDVLSVIPGTGATSLGKAEDAPHTSADVGVMSLAVRRDANSTLVDTDGDYSPLQVDATGSLKVAIISGAGGGMTDDTAFTPATSTVSPIGAFFDDAAPDSVDEGDTGVVRMSGNRNLYTQLRDAAGNERGVNVTAGNALTVDGSAVTQPISAASLPLPTGAATAANQSTEITSLQLIDDIIKTDDAVFTPATDKVAMVGAEFDDTTPDSVDEGDAGALRMSANRNLYTQLRDAAGNERGVNVTAANALKVDGSAVTQPISGSVSVSGTVTVDGSAVTQPISAASLPLPTGAATAANQSTEITSLQLIDDIIKTDDTAFTPATDKVAMIGAEFDNTTPDSVDEGDAGALRMSANRSLHINIRDAAGNERGANVTAGNALTVDGSAVTQPISGTVSVSGTVTVDSELPTAAALADATANPTTTSIGVDNLGFNGTTWDRLRTVANGTDSTGTGILATGLLAQFDNTTPTTITENQFGNLRISANRNLFSTIRDAAGNERGVNVTAGNALTVDGSAVTQPVSIAGTVTVDSELPTAAALADATANPTTPLIGANNEVFNGTTWDRMRSVVNGQDTTGTGIQGAGILGQLDDTGTGAVTENQFAPVRISTRRALLVEGVASGTNINVNLAASAATVTVDTELPTAAAIADAAANPTTTTVGVVNSVFNGTTWDRARSVVNGQDTTGTGITAAGILGQFDDTTTGTVTENQFAPIRISSRRAIMNEGVVAHDGPTTANPVMMGARANANEPTAVSTDGDVTHLWADLLGRLVVVTGHPNPESPITVNATASGNTTVIGTPGASLSLYICKVSIHNRASTNRLVILQDGAGGTSRWRAELAAEGGGSIIDFGTRGWKLTANTLLNVNLDATGSIDVNVTDYYIAA